MKKSNWLFYSKYIKKNSTNEKEILVAKTKTSYLIGPIINEEFDNTSFYKRLKSNSIYTLSIYKSFSNKKCKKMIGEYKSMLSNNEIIEVFKNGDIVKHKIISVPGENNEE